jgi:anhydro-N-acetylmuramic acid kinase
MSTARAIQSFAGKAMTVAGIMSGTSGDGIDVALVRIAPGADRLRLKLLAHHALPFAKSLRQAVLAAMDAKAISTAELARLNWRLGMAYSEAVKETLLKHPVKLQLVGCHGQTVYHQGKAAPYAGRRLACTWQLGEMAMLASETGVPVVSNFRPADMVAGGQGAPLVSFLDFVLFRHLTRGRVLQNLGGIGNLTAIPPNASPQDLVAFDTGPANMLIDAVTQTLVGKAYDRGGAIAAKGTVLPAVLASAMRHPFFLRRPPKSAGREEFGAKFAADFLVHCKAANARPEDATATATALTARSIRIAYERFVRQSMRGAAVDYLLSGGGTRNPTLFKMIESELAPLGCAVGATDQAGLPSQAKEAAAFALMAYETWHRRPGNVPSATGARRPAILGDITYA